MDKPAGIEWDVNGILLEYILCHKYANKELGRDLKPMSNKTNSLDSFDYCLRKGIAVYALKNYKENSTQKELAAHIGVCHRAKKLRKKCAKIRADWQ